MVGQDTIKKFSLVLPEQFTANVIADQETLQEKNKAFEEQEKAVQISEELIQIKPFLDDFLQAEDYFTDVVPDSYKEGSKFRVLSRGFQYNSWYIQDDFLFNIEPKEWDNEDFLDNDKVRENLELFFSFDENFNIKETSSNQFPITGKHEEHRYPRTIKLEERQSKRIPINSNFCLRIYSLTGLQLILSYDLSISHLNKNFRLEVYDTESLSIICDDFFYYIRIQGLLMFQLGYNERRVTYELIQVSKQTIKTHGKIINVVYNDFHYIFFKKVYLKILNQDDETYPYTKENDKFFVKKVYILPFRTVIIFAGGLKIYVMDLKENQVIFKQFITNEGLRHYCKSKHLLYDDQAQGIKKFIKIVEHNTFKEINLMTNQQQLLQQLKSNKLYYYYNNADADTVVYRDNNREYYHVFNYKDVENQFFFKLVDRNSDGYFFHSGNLIFTIIREDKKYYAKNQTCTVLKYDQALNRSIDLEEDTEIIDFKQTSQYKLRQLNTSSNQNDYIREFAFKQQWIEGSIPKQIRSSATGKLKGVFNNLIIKINKEFFWQFIYENSGIQLQKMKLENKVQSDLFKYILEFQIVFNKEILDITPIKAVLSETNQFILATDDNLIGVIFDLRNQTLIKSDDLTCILQTLTMTEHQIVLVQQEKNKIMINKYKIEKNTLIKKSSYDLTQHVKQFDINNEIIPIKSDINDKRKLEINRDLFNVFYYQNELKNIIIFKLPFQSVNDCYDYIVFHLDNFQFIGSFSVNKPLYQYNYRFYCAQEDNIYKTNIINYLIDNFDLINPMKLHVKIDVDLNKYEYYLNSQVVHFSQYEFKSMYQTIISSLNLQKNQSDYQLIRDIQNMSETDIFNYNQGLHSSFIFTCIDRSELVIEECFKRLLQINPPINPQICLPHLGKGTILDYCVQNHQYRKINIILSMIIKFNNNLLFNNCIDPYICYMLEKKINLKEYFESQLPYPQITSIAYPRYSQDSSVIFSTEIDKKSLTYPSLWNDYDKYIGKSVDEKSGQPLVEIQYNLINIPDTLNKKNFIKNLRDSPNLEYFETEFIQTILNFKWERYAKKFFINQFYLYLVFLISYILDLYFFTIHADAEQDSRSIIQQLVLKLTCIGYLLHQEYYELLMISRIGFVNYFNDLWNVIDQALTLLYFLIVIIDTQEITYDGIVIMHSCTLIIIFIKLCEVLRVFQGFSYQVSMLKAVFMDLRFFIMLYAFVVIVYGLIFTLLKIKTSDENIEYDGISYFGYFVMAFRASTGDFQIDNIYQLDQTHIIFAWIVWISAVLFLNIVLLNFIIAVISESYEKVMQKMVAESFRIKAELIQERESYFNHADFQNQNYFPDYIIFRRPAEDQVDANEEWQGFVKDIKKTIYKTHLKSIHTEKEILTHMKTVESTVKDLQIFNQKIESSNKNQETSNKNQETLIKSLETQIKNQETSNKNLQTSNKILEISNKNQETLIQNLEIKMETIQSSIDQILKALQDKLIV
eukprot:403363900